MRTCFFLVILFIFSQPAHGGKNVIDIVAFNNNRATSSNWQEVIQAAIAANGDSTTLVFRPGLYPITQAIDLRGLHGCVVEGNGATIVAGNYTILHLSNCKDVHISDLNLNGQWNGDTTGNNQDNNGIQADICTGIRIANCRIRRIFGNGIRLDKSSFCKVTGNAIDSCLQNGISICFFHADNGTPPCDNNIVSDNTISFTGRANGIFATSDAGSLDNSRCVNNTLIEGNTVTAAADIGIESGIRCIDTKILGNTILNAANGAIMVRDNKSCIVSGNSCRKNDNGGHYPRGDAAIRLDNQLTTNNKIRESYSLIEGNTIEGASSAGITIAGPDYVSVTGNMISDSAGGSTGITVSSSSSITIASNTINNVVQGILVDYGCEYVRIMNNSLSPRKSDGIGFSIGSGGSKANLYRCVLSDNQVESGRSLMIVDKSATVNNCFLYGNEFPDGMQSTGSGKFISGPR